MKITHSFVNFLMVLLPLVMVSCQEEKELPIIIVEAQNIEDAAMIPYPNTIVSDSGGFALGNNTVFSFDSTNLEQKKIAEYFEEALYNSYRIDFNSLKGELSYKPTIIHFAESPLKDISHNEAYKLTVKQDSIILRSNSSVGTFRGLQTLRQLIPNTSIDTIANYNIWPIPTGTITDYPNFDYRGTMLDVSRHFFTVDEVKNYIDVLAYYKINFLHLHLSDDQGWRIEIKSWPKLTEIGGKTEVGGGEGGFYTQEDYKNIVTYAAERYITIIPEIDMPGHTNAASLSYPILNGNGKTLKPYTGMRVGFSTFNTKKDTVYAFIDDVVREISALTPGPYFHIGGDESHVTKKTDYVNFVDKVEKIVQKYGKKMIGWDEVATADMDSTSVAQFWNSEENAKTAVSKNMMVILSPGKKAYLDMKYNEDSEYGLTWAGNIPVDTAYNWNPETYIKNFPKQNILGIEAPLWSETISNLRELQYLAFPRVIGYAELGWTNASLRNWDAYRLRLAAQQNFLEKNNINYYRSSLIDWKK